MMFSLVCEECYKRFSPVVLKKGTVPQNSNDNRYLNADFEPKVEKESNQNKKRLTEQKGFKIKIFFFTWFQPYRYERKFDLHAKNDIYYRRSQKEKANCQRILIARAHKICPNHFLETWKAFTTFLIVLIAHNTFMSIKIFEKIAFLKINAAEQTWKKYILRWTKKVNIVENDLVWIENIGPVQNVHAITKMHNRACPLMTKY